MVLLPSLFIIIFSEPAYRWHAQSGAPLDIKEEYFLDSLVEVLHEPVPANSIPQKTARFPFDPNVASLNEFKSLGIPEFIGKRIIQYRNKGGQFRIKSDFAKIYGLDPSLYQSLVPYILLPDRIVKEPLTKKEKTEKREIVVEYDLNQTDTTSLQSVKGIGPAFSKRIIKYRESLGGFINIAQLAEVYGIDSIALAGLKSFYVSDQYQPVRIKINVATEVELSRHPYISNRDARSIITYRHQHGNFSNLNDLLKIKTLKESVVTKMGPYLSFE